jgi:hypothetical protein
MLLRKKPKLSSEDKSYIYEKMFDYQKEQHASLLQSISETRNICNQITITILIFTGFIISIENQTINTILRKLIFYSLLAIIVAIWTKINWSIKVTVGFNPAQTKNLFSIKENEDEPNKEKIFEQIFNASVREYSILKQQLEITEKYKKWFLKVSLIFLITTIINLLLTINF